MARQTLQERWDKLDRDKAQRRLALGAGAAAVTAAGLRATPLGARGLHRALKPWTPKTPKAKQFKQKVYDVGHGKMSAKLERSANTTGIVSGLVGAGSSFKWGSSLKRDIADQEESLGRRKPSVDLAKAMWREDERWKEHVSPGAMRWYATTDQQRRRNRDAAVRWGAGAAATGAAAGAGVKLRSPSLAVAGAVPTAYMAVQSGRRASYARGWKKEGRMVSRRGEARARGISDDVPAKELPEMVGKAFGGKVLRPVKAYRFNPQRAGSMARRGPRVVYRRGTV
jgi:hypothetical protein